MNRLMQTEAVSKRPRIEVAERMPLYPLRFEPILRRLIWGGRRLGSVLGKCLGEENDYAESWEIADHSSGVSRVSEGVLQGAKLSDILHEFGPGLLGKSLSGRSQFPLLIKYLDAQQTLSVQVHPDDEMGRLLVGDNGKTEAWLVLHAEPDSFLYAGLREGVTQREFAAVLGTDRLVPLLHRVQVQPGDCFLIRAGTVHAIGAGVLLAEVQQMSDATFRLYDWGRLDPSGRPRALHLAEALQATNFQLGPITRVIPEVVQEPRGTRERLVSTPYFSLERLNFSGQSSIGCTERFTVLLGLAGTAEVHYESLAYSLSLGETLLLPAELGSCVISSDQPCSILQCVVP